MFLAWVQIWLMNAWITLTINWNTCILCGWNSNTLLCRLQKTQDQYGGCTKTWLVTNWVINLEESDMGIVMDRKNVDQNHANLRELWALTTLFMVFSVTCVVVSLTLFWGICQVIPMINNVTNIVTSWCSSVLTDILAWVCSLVLWGVCLCYTMVYKLTKVNNDSWH